MDTYKNDLIDEKKAHYAIHFPKDRNELAQARKRIIFDEFFLFTTNIRCAKSARLNEDNLYRITESGEALHVLKKPAVQSYRCPEKSIQRDFK